MAHRLRIVIKKDATTKISVSGISGPRCKDITKPFEDLMGRKTSDIPTEEMNKVESRTSLSHQS
jgi:hypothetical protein